MLEAAAVLEEGEVEEAGAGAAAAAAASCSPAVQAVQKETPKPGWLITHTHKCNHTHNESLRQAVFWVQKCGCKHARQALWVESTGALWQ